jgi:hypothetical protein
MDAPHFPQGLSMRLAPPVKIRLLDIDRRHPLFERLATICASRADQAQIQDQAIAGDVIYEGISDLVNLAPDQKRLSHGVAILPETRLASSDNLTLPARTISPQS